MQTKSTKIIAAIAIVCTFFFAVFLATGCSSSNTQTLNNEEAESKEASNVSEASATDSANVTQNTNGSKVLVAYFSNTGTTERIANIIAEAENADIFLIEPEEAYTQEDTNYNNSNSRVYQEHDQGANRNVALKINTPPNFDNYSIVFIGYPIWWGGAAFPVETFARENNFEGKTIIPFCTSGSSSIGSSATDLESLAQSGTWLEGQRFSSSAQASDVLSWVQGLNL